MSVSSSLKSLVTICILAAFVSSTVVESYKCAQCEPEECNNGIEKTCDTSLGCFSEKKELNKTGQQQQPNQRILKKGCSLGKCDPKAFSATLGNGYTFGYGYRCCQTENCNKADFQVARKSSDPNGITCPACYSDQGSTCQPTNLTCRGEETKCLVFVGTASGVLPVFGMGCATETACNLKDMEVIDNVKIHTGCAGSSSGSPHLTSIIPSILTALFLLKVLL
ncbi:ly6/PLAUR domain-containing protein 8 isoform X1 [Hylobates moloch]|uniref:ly6/PLAUR domain-containing protein 8 isoform X1 n=1 Tax=Hylobates moloch TaxID=81572 RepID=UPI0013622770|nr:ly6/PLAUR domain-containing protein 8 isoform X1 [Hylobates moloch]XP_058286767.1 ly6/PLAUR domain-containing protein 8 isoform X1 [Hylobates moloch]